MVDAPSVIRHNSFLDRLFFHSTYDPEHNNTHGFRWSPGVCSHAVVASASRLCQSPRRSYAERVLGLSTAPTLRLNAVVSRGAMNKKFAFDNRLCYEREVLRQHAIHQTKLQTILPTCLSPSKVYLDNNEPPRQTHLSLNRKRLQLEKERQMDIYTQNQRLAAKMEHILNRQENAVLASGTLGSPRSALLSPRGPKSPKKPEGKPVHSPAHVHMPGIRLDSSQTPMVDCHLSPEFAMGRGNACKKTTLVNKAVVKRKQMKIEEENRRMQERLKAQKPFYNTKKWDSDWQHTATKFQHLHQNGTVGYLLPKTAEGGSHARERSPLIARRVKTRAGLPTLKPKTSHGMKPLSRGDRLQAKQSQDTTAPSQGYDVLTIEHEEEDDEPEIIECEPFVLLEATTRKGVEIAVEELQIEMRDPVSGVVQPGDRYVGIWLCVAKY